MGNGKIMMALDTEFRMTLLSGNSESVLFCRARSLRGRRLIAELSGPAHLNACVKIDREGSLVLGEVLACWREGTGVVAVIELQQALTGYAGLASEWEEVSQLQQADRRAA